MSLSHLEQDLPAYVDWTALMWTQDPGEIGIKDWAVMALGLGGETGEVLDVLEQAQASGTLDKADARKEMGDVFYYWCRILHAFDLQVLHVLQAPTHAHCLQADTIALHLQAGDPQAVHSAASALSARVGTVQELCKKLIRDGAMDEARLLPAMREVGHAWFQLAWSLGLKPSEIIKANVAKLSSRRERGVLRGSGNDR